MLAAQDGGKHQHTPYVGTYRAVHEHASMASYEVGPPKHLFGRMTCVLSQRGAEVSPQNLIGLAATGCKCFSRAVNNCDRYSGR